MAIKTMSLDDEANDRLKAHKGEGERLAWSSSAARERRDRVDDRLCE